EWRTLSTAEQQKFLKSVRITMERPSPKEPSIYDLYARKHGDVATDGKAGGYIHNSPHFLPWHRFFIWTYEQELQKLDSSIMLPYWYWQIDSQVPETAPIWGENLFGTN